MKKNCGHWYKVGITILIVLFSSYLTKATPQNPIDSLKTLLETDLNEEDKIDVLINLANQYRLQNDEISALNVAYKAYNKAKAAKEDFAIARARFLITSLTIDFLPVDSAVYYLKESLREFEKENALKEIASAQNLLGIAFEKQGKYKQAMHSYFKALFIFDQLKDIRGIANAYNNIGLVFQLEEHYSQAVLYFGKALKYGEELKDENINANALNNIAIIYREQKKPQKALAYFLEVYKIDKKQNIPQNLALTYNNLGVVYLDLGQYQLSRNYLLLAAKLKLEKGDAGGMANTYNNLGDLYVRLKKYDSAEVFLQNAMRLSKEENNLALLQETYHTYATFYEQKGDFARSLEYTRKAIVLNDSLTKLESTINLSQLEDDYLRLSSEKLELEKASRSEKFRMRLKLYSLSVLTGVVIFCFLLYYIIKVKRINKNMHLKQKKIEIQNKILQVKNIEILQAKEAAEEAAKVKSQFLSTISHEIRTPLNAIIGVANLLNQNSPQPQQYENLNILKISSENLLSLVNNILDFSKMEAGKMQLETIDFNLRSIVFDVKELFSIKSVEKGVELLVHFDEKIPSVLKGDPLRINQLLINLVNNGIKFTESGFVKIDISLQLSTINHALVHFAISDTGIGISHSKQSQIFESFTQADANTTRKYGGTGLGLSICKKILENLNSKLQLESSSGKGSTFYFTINFEVSRNASIGKSAKTASFEDSIKGKRVLIVEDNMMNVMVLRQFLQKWGVITEVALNGKEGYDRVKESTFDAVLMDIHMPEMDGIEATLLIRKLTDERKRRVPIIAITAENEMQFRQKVYEVGMNDYIFKPFNPDDLKERLGYALYNNTLNISNFKAIV